MGFASIHPFVRFAVRADASFNTLNEPECQALLSLARVAADWAFKTFLGHCPVSFSDGFHWYAHKSPLPVTAALAADLVRPQGSPPQLGAESQFSHRSLSMEFHLDLSKVKIIPQSLE